MESTNPSFEKVFLACDHAGFELMEVLRGYLKEKKVNTVDLGVFSTAACDYPDYGKLLGQELVKAGAEKNLGILVCGSGIGIHIAANKVSGVRAAWCHDYYTAKMSRTKLNCNVVSMGARVIGTEIAKQIVDVFLDTKVEVDESHKKFAERLAEIEKENLKY
eukprot:CAMPEP_0176410440 /NCGR_PEP_ID=MMETSP0127-20121128/3058_1 /TAXON_ID=938130 /ORGANISM="Platyophrya macrostoma, Strain WH" /LENGTH=161 /DNA_ID=CAMNT_0017789937 /DNA_START=6 /DNA_END=491 /DNA_ORIENTATION=-